MRSQVGLRSWLPLAAAALAAGVGATNVATALSPDFPAGLARIGRFAPDGLMLAGHALMLPAGLALLVLAGYLARRRRRALWLTVGVLVGVGILRLADGADVVQAAVSWSLAGILVGGRRAFVVRHGAGSLGGALRQVLAIAAGVPAVAAVTVLIAATTVRPEPSAGILVREVADVIGGERGPLRFSDAFSWLPIGVGLLAATALLVAAWILFRPLAPPAEAPSSEVRQLVHDLVHAHGSDTLSAFKLRPDVGTLLSDDRRALVGYRVENGVLLMSGDPVGPDDALPGLLDRVRGFAEQRGLRVAAVGASEGFAARAREAGLRTLYLGDEALLSTAEFSLEGRAVKKIRQAVNRLVREGYRAEVRRVGGCSAATLDALDAVSARWRDGAPERGFSMAMDGLHGEHVADSLVVLALDREQRIRGFLHFVPAYGRPTMSLSAMRRDPDTPNGLTEFLVVRAVEQLGERGVAELSLNFAAFARWLHDPAGAGERAMARIIRRVDPYFQIESLYRFNAKFLPRWQPRYLVYERGTALPRTALAALRIEGQIAYPSAPWRRPIPLSAAA